ncbi:MAG: hypothetical protein HOV81_36160 [Kofleriaceae bacterium]|nr:hypothetical protein [Kofleriaceae bacterium]
MVAALGLAACGPTVKPPSPPAEPEPVSQGTTQLKVAPAARRVVVGEMCPQGAGGRPAVAPLVMRAVDWNDTVTEVAATVERGSVPRFVVMGTDGRVAGTFETLGMVEVGIAQSVATGTYVGASPCTYSTSAGPKPGALDTRAEDPKCGPATRGCGIAVGELVNPGDPPSTATYETGGACLSGTELAVDIDGDGKIESFPLAGALDGTRAPAQEWTASPTATAACQPSYQLYGLELKPEPRPGKPADKGLVTVDVLGVIDLDGDGRREIVLSMKFPTVRSIVVYTATEQAQRLELAGEATSFSR